MESMRVKDIMVPLEEYAVVNEDATLYEAVLALEKARERFRKDREKHRAILVLNENKTIVGKLSQHDVIKGLEPGYDKLGEQHSLSRSGFTTEFMKKMLKEGNLWQEPLGDICQKAAQITVKTIMYNPGIGEYVDEDASLGEAVHQLIIGDHHSLLVMKSDRIVGILRLSDVFTEICDRIKNCNIPNVVNTNDLKKFSNDM
jgi:CBS domain containing-hemolysin-like protein